MFAGNIINTIEKIANPCWQADWDKSGLQVASTRSDISCLGIFLDGTPTAIRQALDAGADLLLSHHPLSLRPCLPNRLDCWHKALRLLLGADVALYAAHTSLDVNPGGPAGWFGRALRLKNSKPLEKIGSQPDGIPMGYGEVGDLPEPVDSGELVEHILGLVGLSHAQIAGGELPARIQRVAYCGGSGASLIEPARKAGAELYVTGDVKYHAALEQAEMPVLDVGHHALEEEMMRRFAALLAEMLPMIQVKFFPSLSPFRYVCKEEI